ncbi:Mechanosensitive channel MscK [Myxococcaceae bacterium]|nr:Mechanosensitive channel MscK [Myxococcaceae bacterium]
MRSTRRRARLVAEAAAWLFVPALALAAPPGPGGAQAAAAGAETPAVATPVAKPDAPEAPIALAEISARSEELRSRLRSLQAAASRDADLHEIEREVTAFGERIAANEEETREILDQGPRLSLLEELESGWREGRRTLALRSERLAERARDAQVDLEFLSRSRDLWRRTLDAAGSDDAPQATLDRVSELLDEIDDTSRRVSALRARTLALQDGSTGLLGRIDDILAAIETHRRETVERLWVADALPLWRLGSERGDLAEAGDRIRKDARLRLDHAIEFLRWKKPALALQFAFGLLLAVVCVRARSKTARWREEEPETADAFRVFELPYSSAIVLTLISTILIHPELPRLVLQAIAMFALWPVVRILRPLVPSVLHGELYALAAFFVLDRIRDLLAPSPVIEQCVLAFEMALGAVLLALILRNARRIERAGSEPPPGPGRVLYRRLEGVLLVGFVAGFVASVAGLMQFARLVASALLAALYVAMALYAGARTLRGLVAVALRVRPLSRLRLVEHHRALVEERLGRWIGMAGIVLWAYATLRNLGFLGPIVDGASAVLDATMHFGTFEISLGDLVAMGITLWVSILVSRLVRFVLEEDVFPRVELGRGVPYALSSLIGYTIVLIGFLLALATIGLDVNRATILAGAFGVGIGFGLQNIVNNFVSGLILLFERPVQVGDVVQIGEVMGEVRRIGIRSSTLRTFTGAEVIVPNADLIAERVTNWTLSDSTRRIEIPVGVEYGTDPERVVRLLEETARGHPEVLAFPAPMSIFVRFGESSMDFELRAWVRDGTRWSQTRTELAIEVWKALQGAGITIPFPQREVRAITD